MSTRRVTAEQLAEMVARYESGQSIRAIAAEMEGLSLSYSAVRWYLRDAGVRLRPPGPRGPSTEGG